MVQKNFVLFGVILLIAVAYAVSVKDPRTDSVKNTIVNQNTNDTANQNSTITTFTNSTPHISLISPSSGADGVRVTLTGTGFTKNGNTITFCAASGVTYCQTQVGDIASPDGTHLTFTLQKTITMCPPRTYMEGANGTCYDAEFLPGEYDVHVTNTHPGPGNAVRFTILP